MENNAPSFCPTCWLNRYEGSYWLPRLLGWDLMRPETQACSNCGHQFTDSDQAKKGQTVQLVASSKSK